jgi:tRNA dimethylallyltransferase
MEGVRRSPRPRRGAWIQPVGVERVWYDPTDGRVLGVECRDDVDARVRLEAWVTTGKTALAVEVALRIGGEVISMDSRQVYRLMDVGTAKPTLAERRGVPHHGFDLVTPDQRFNAGRFAEHARGWIADIQGRGHVPILAGGTGFFLRALTHPMFDEPPVPEPAREAWKQYLRDLDTAELVRWAAALDPENRVRAQDRQRLSRVIEVAVLTGRPLTWWQRSAESAAPAIDPLVFVLDLPRSELYRRIESRVDDMVEAGLAAEVEALLARGYGERDPGMNATGYIELIPCFRGERTLTDALDLVKAATRRYARRQHTWLRHQLPDGAIILDATASTTELAALIAARWTEENS